MARQQTAAVHCGAHRGRLRHGLQDLEHRGGRVGHILGQILAPQLLLLGRLLPADLHLELHAWQMRPAGSEPLGTTKHTCRLEEHILPCTCCGMGSAFGMRLTCRQHCCRACFTACTSSSMSSAAASSAFCYMTNVGNAHSTCATSWDSSALMCMKQWNS